VNALQFTDLRTGISSPVHQSFVFTKCSSILIAEFCSNTGIRISPFTENLMCEKTPKMLEDKLAEIIFRKQNV
jgi:hypothetical protein